MKRLSYFVLLGPFLIWLTFVALLMPRIIANPDIPVTFFVAMIFGFYVAGLLPLLAIAGIDTLMARQHWSARVLVCAVLGWVAAYALCYYFSQAAGGLADFKEYGLLLGLLGAIPAAVCSWLSGQQQERAL